MDLKSVEASHIFNFKGQICYAELSSQSQLIDLFGLYFWRIVWKY